MGWAPLATLALDPQKQGDPLNPTPTILLPNKIKLLDTPGTADLPPGAVTWRAARSGGQGAHKIVKCLPVFEGHL